MLKYNTKHLYKSFLVGLLQVIKQRVNPAQFDLDFGLYFTVLVYREKKYLPEIIRII